MSLTTAGSGINTINITITITTLTFTITSITTLTIPIITTVTVLQVGVAGCTAHGGRVPPQPTDLLGGQEGQQGRRPGLN